MHLNLVCSSICLLSSSNQHLATLPMKAISGCETEQSTTEQRGMLKVGADHVQVICLETPMGSRFQELMESNLDIVLYLLLNYFIVKLKFSYTVGLSVFAITFPGFGKKITDDFGNC